MEKNTINVCEISGKVAINTCEISEKNTINTCEILERKANKEIQDYGFRHKIHPTNDNNKEEGNEETYRTKLRRQRDKILYTGGFRRLQDKTQVMAAMLKGDHRTRLTHTLEVEQIAVSVSDALGLNKDLASAIALGHDVGHTPFGHAAERALDKKLKDIGGFHHPIQSVKYLWGKYNNNIVNEIYEGILLHDSDMFNIAENKAESQLSSIDNELWEICKPFFGAFPSTLEAQAVIWADKIAYITHDLEDFINSRIYISLKKSETKKDYAPKTEKHLCCILKKLTGKDISKIDDFKSRDLIRSITTNLIKTSAENIKKIALLTQSTVKEETQKISNELSNSDNKKKLYLNSLIINFSEKFRCDYYELRELLDKKYIFSPEVQRSDAKAQNIICFLYDQFTGNYKLTPLEIREKIDEALRIIIYKYLNQNDFDDDTIDVLEMRIEKISNYKKEKENVIARIVASYISTMSDTYAENMFCDLSGSKDNYSL